MAGKLLPFPSRPSMASTWRFVLSSSTAATTSSLLSPPKNYRLSSPSSPFRFQPPLPSIRSEFEPDSSELLCRYRSWDGGGSGDIFEEEHPYGEENGGFDLAVSLFNGGDYHRCHDVLEEMWNVAEEPLRTLIHGILQCAVGFHHLFNQNHRGAMMELGEGLCKLRKMDFEGGPFLQFEGDISTALEFLYQTQKELAACTNDMCLAMDGSERSYQLFGSFAAGQRIYSTESGTDGVSYIIFSPNGNYSLDNPVKVKLPVLHATEEHLDACVDLQNS